MASGPRRGEGLLGPARALPRKARVLVEAAFARTLRESPLACLTQWGARLMLQVALEEAVLAFVGRDWYERSHGATPRGWRNGSPPRTVKVAGGDGHLAMPQSRGAGQPFHSRLLPPDATRVPELEEALPLLSRHGLSTRRARTAVGKLLGQRGVSKGTVLRLPHTLVEPGEAWRVQDLTALDVVSRFLDGIRLGVRAGTREKEAVVVAHAVLADGRREVLAVALGSRESTRAWTALLEALRRRGHRAPLLIIPDGGTGLLAAIETHCPEVPRQHCPTHTLATVLKKVPTGVQPEVGDAARRVLSAPPRAQAEEAWRFFQRASHKRVPSAVACLERDLEACWPSYQFPVSHWKRIRTTNVLERSVREVRRRVRDIGRFQDALRALAMVHALLEEARGGWRRLAMPAEAQRLLSALRAQQQTDAA